MSWKRSPYIWLLHPHSSILWDLVPCSFGELFRRVTTAWLCGLWIVWVRFGLLLRLTMLTPLSPASFLPWLPKSVLLPPFWPLDLALFCHPLSLLSSLRYRLTHILPGYACLFFFFFFMLSSFSSFGYSIIVVERDMLAYFVMSLCHWLWNEISVPMVTPELCSHISHSPPDSSNCLYYELLIPSIFTNENFHHHPLQTSPPSLFFVVGGVTVNHPVTQPGILGVSLFSSFPLTPPLWSLTSIIYFSFKSGVLKIFSSLNLLAIW